MNSTGLKPRSRWDDDEEPTTASNPAKQRKIEKEAKKKALAERQRRAIAASAPTKANTNEPHPSKRRRTSQTSEVDNGLDSIPKPAPLLRFPSLGWTPCRNVDNFERLNHIEEGSYGWVSRAREISTGEVVALKRLKIDKASSARDGFPVTGLREIQTLQASQQHPHIVNLREIAIGTGADSANGDTYLVMEFLEHDLKTLQEDMLEPFLPSETKTLLMQLTSAVSFLHANWILHRDLKTSNILLNNRGQIKVADFGMARVFSDPPPEKLTQLVVTLWYRAPELILGQDKYGSAVDLWSVGCIFGELLLKEPILQGKHEVDQLTKIFELCGIPTSQNWPGYQRLPNARLLRLPTNSPNAHGSVIRAKFPLLTSAGTELLSSLLSLNPAGRPSADEVLKHRYFAEDPRPKHSAVFPTFPSKANQEKRRRLVSPSVADHNGAQLQGKLDALTTDEIDLTDICTGRDSEQVGGGFSLRLV